MMMLFWIGISKQWSDPPLAWAYLTVIELLAEAVLFGFLLASVEVF
jgi:hypothetical protein